MAVSPEWEEKKMVEQLFKLREKAAAKPALIVLLMILTILLGRIC